MVARNPMMPNDQRVEKCTLLHPSYVSYLPSLLAHSWKTKKKTEKERREDGLGSR